MKPFHQPDDVLALEAFLDHEDHTTAWRWFYSGLTGVDYVLTKSAKGVYEATQ